MVVKILKYLICFIPDIMYMICLLPDTDIENTRHLILNMILTPDMTWTLDIDT